VGPGLILLVLFAKKLFNVNLVISVFILVNITLDAVALVERLGSLPLALVVEL
jgi:hypothetical protein